MLVTLCIIQFIIGAGAIWFIHRKYLNTRQKLKETCAGLEEQQTEWISQKRRLEAQLDCKKTELSSQSLHYIQKIELVNELRKSLEVFKKSIPKELVSKLNRIIDGVNAFEQVDQEWDNFRNYFNDANYGFFDQLRTQYPNLSAKDLKLCALIRLNLETKQIATIMGVSPESAKVTRHRIRKKLGLSGDDNIYDFLNKITTMN